jgi:tRNA(adenine34) deaminase
LNPTVWMREAVTEAEKALHKGEVPIGAVVVLDNKIIARSHNLVETKHDATCHAERLAISQASKAISNWRLNNASLFVTLEPCTMCIGAMILARVKALYFGCLDPRQGAAGSLFDLSDYPAMPHTVEVYGGILEEECRKLLEKFFKNIRT